MREEGGKSFSSFADVDDVGALCLRKRTFRTLAASFLVLFTHFDTATMVHRCRR